MAPDTPSMLRTGALVAWLSEGSCTDQVANAIASSCRKHKQREAAELAQAPAQRVAHRVGKEGQTVEAAPDHRHAVPHPSTATRRCSACAVVSWSCTIATLI